MNICDRCKKTDCKYKNRPIENYTIFSRDNCILKYTQDAAAIKPELIKIVKTCENKPGFFGLYSQAAELLKIAEKAPEASQNADKVKEAARRIYEYMPPWDLDGATPETIADEITQNPIDTILYLLDIVENQ